MNVYLYGVLVTIIGLAVVFVGLCILIACIGLIRQALKISDKPDATPAPKAAAALVAEPVAVEAPAPVQDNALIAVLTAAVAAALQGEQSPSNSGFVVRSVRRVHNAPQWQRAGREEQIYNRF